MVRVVYNAVHLKEWIENLTKIDSVTSNHDHILTAP